MLSLVCTHSFAQPLDDVSLEYQASGIVATIRMTEPVRYLRHFPEKHGKTLEIYYEAAPGASTSEKWVDNELRKSPPSMLIPAFTVTTRDQQTQPKLVIEFSRDADYDVGPGKDNRSLLITLRPDKLPVSTTPLPELPVVKPETLILSAVPLTEDEVIIADNNKKARLFMLQARDALQAKDYEPAVDAFNKLLLLPPNDYTQDGQEWIGVARERIGQIDKARTEYDLYLKIYPEGEGAVRVVQRLVSLSGRDEAGKPTSGEVAGKKREARWVTFGGVSSRYYYSHSKIDSKDPFNSATSTTTQSFTDQSMLISSLDASERYLSEEYDGRLVFRDVNTHNFLANQPSQNRVNSAYGEIRNRIKHYQLRLGRQSSTGDGVLGRFDGISGSYGDTSQTSIGGVAGALSDFSQGSKPVFVGGSVNKGPVSLYAISQRVDGLNDRRAIGSELRYFEGNRSAFALLDYDTYFKALNAAQIIGTIGAFGGTANFMVDHRKTPSLSIRNALLGASTSSVNALVQSLSASSVRELALARTATSNMGQLGFTWPLIDKWQVGGDVRLANTSGLPASGTGTLEGVLAAQSGRGTEKSVTGQVIGSSLYKDKDVWSGSITLNTSSAVNGYTIYVYNYMLFNSGWTMNTSLQLYRDKNQYGGKTTRVSPTVRGAYRIKEQLYVDLDGGIDRTDFDGPQLASKTTRIFSSIGLRWDY
ncbi:MAG: tetratricopeptide repeat protein [Gallionella sp.]